MGSPNLTTVTPPGLQTDSRSNNAGHGAVGLFPKAQRLCSKTLIDRLFNAGASHSLSAFPVRVVYMLADNEDGGEPVRLLISVPKRCFKRAVKRNRVKRQIREAYRLNSLPLRQHVASTGKMLLVAFIWMDNRLHTTATVEHKVKHLLAKLVQTTAPHDEE